MKIQVYSNTSDLTIAAADLFIKSAMQAIKVQEIFTVALSGGSTPQPLYDLLTTSQAANDLPWDKIHFFWSDERAVPPDHPESNFGQTNKTLLKIREIPIKNIHRIRGELEPTAAAESYQAEILGFFQGSTPHFDLILLGMGEDGHTASLFPGTEVVVHHSEHQWVAANHIPQLDTWRITFTPRLINNARRVTFLVAGHNKAKNLKKVLEGPYQPELYPSQLIKPVIGQLLWMVDQKAGKTLNID